MALLCCLLCAVFALVRPTIAFPDETTTVSFNVAVSYDDNPNTHTNPEDYRYGVATYEELSIPADTFILVELPNGEAKEVGTASEVAQQNSFEGTSLYDDYLLEDGRYTRYVFDCEKNRDGTPKIVDGELTFVMKPAVKRKQLVRYTGKVNTQDGGEATTDDTFCYVAWGNTITVAGKITAINYPFDSDKLEYLSPTPTDPAKLAAYELSWDDAGNATLTVVEFGSTTQLITYPDATGAQQTLTVSTGQRYYVNGEERTADAAVTLAAPSEGPAEGYETIGYALTYNENGEPVFTTTSGTPKEYTLYYTYDTDSWADKDYDEFSKPAAAPAAKSVTKKVTYHTGDSVELMQPPSRWEYIFLGWYISDDGGKTVKAGVGSVEAGTYGDIQLYAAWVKCWGVSFARNDVTGQQEAAYTSLAPVANTQIPVVVTNTEGKAVLDGALKASADFVPDDACSGGMGYKYDLRANEFDVQDENYAALHKQLVSLGVEDQKITAAYTPSMFMYRLNSAGVSSNEVQIDNNFGKITLSLSVPKGYRNHRFHIVQLSSDGGSVVKLLRNQRPNENGCVQIILTSLSPVVLVDAGEIMDGDPAPDADPDAGDGSDLDDHNYTDVEEGKGPVTAEVDPGRPSGGNSTKSSGVQSSTNANNAASDLFEGAAAVVPKTYLKEVGSTAEDKELNPVSQANSWLSENGPLVTGVSLGSIVGLLGAGMLLARLRTKADYKHFW